MPGVGSGKYAYGIGGQYSKFICGMPAPLVSTPAVLSCNQEQCMGTIQTGTTSQWRVTALTCENLRHVLLLIVIMSIMYFNARSLTPKHDKLCTTVKAHNPDMTS